MLLANQNYRTDKPESIEPKIEFWAALAGDAKRIREQLIARANASSPIERKRLLKLADCAFMLAEILTPLSGPTVRGTGRE